MILMTLISYDEDINNNYDDDVGDYFLIMMMIKMAKIIIFMI